MRVIDGVTDGKIKVRILKGHNDEIKGMVR